MVVSDHSMDFFSAVNESSPVAGQAENVDSFTEAISSRFGSASILTARLAPQDVRLPATTDPPPAMPSSPMANMSIAPSPPTHRFTTVAPEDLPEWVNTSDTLVVDIRPHAAYSTARLRHALSLSVPSTLLKRPLFSLERLAAMLPSPSSRSQFAAWRSAARILVYDADSSVIAETSNIYGLLRKFRNDGFTGHLAWLHGGLQAVRREMREVIDTHPPSPEGETEDEDVDRPTSLAPGVLRTRHLPLSAFTHSSTIHSVSLPSNPVPLRRSMTLPAQRSAPNAASNPFFDAIRQNVELSHGITERIPLRLSKRVRRRINDLPFRWLQDIARKASTIVTPPLSSNQRSISHTLPKSIIDSSGSDSELDPLVDTFVPDPDPADIEEGNEALAMQFYRIELAEQRRLMGVMEHHSRESGPLPLPLVQPLEPLVKKSKDKGKAKQVSFPFSITAGVEKGAKNRYQHIWPFEHARVKLHQRYRRSKPVTGVDLVSEEEYDDYVNASYVQPIGTSKRYIATQGPLPATFVDFWTLVWEQNVHVIVMLTREMEGGVVKCGAYWKGEQFGPLLLKLVSTTEDKSQPEAGEPANPFFAPFAPVAPSTTRSTPLTIKRVFQLSHLRYPSAGERMIIQLQYLDWPDMNVPDSPRGILDLVKEMERAVQETREDEMRKASTGSSRSSPGPGLLSPKSPTSTTSTSSDEEVNSRTGIFKHALGDRAPMLLHCSAGVGRTGGFIAIDAVLDGVRREIRKRIYGSVAGSSGDASVSGGVSGSGRVSGSGSGTGSGRGSDGRATGGRGGSPEEGDAKMDVDVSVGMEMAMGGKMGGTVPIPMTAGDASPGESGGSGSNNGDGDDKRGTHHHHHHHHHHHDGDGEGGLVVHVPFVVPTGEDTLKTPIQIVMELGDEEGGKLGRGESESVDVLTRKWVETISDETGGGIGLAVSPGGTSSGGSPSPGEKGDHSPPAIMPIENTAIQTPPTTRISTTSLSTTTTSSSSEASYGFKHRTHHQYYHYQDVYGTTTSSSLATSVSSGLASKAGSGPGSSHGSGFGSNGSGDGNGGPRQRHHQHPPSSSPTLSRSLSASGKVGGTSGRKEGGASRATTESKSAFVTSNKSISSLQGGGDTGNLIDETKSEGKRRLTTAAAATSEPASSRSKKGDSSELSQLGLIDVFKAAAFSGIGTSTATNPGSSLSATNENRASALIVSLPAIHGNAGQQHHHVHAHHHHQHQHGYGHGHSIHGRGHGRGHAHGHSTSASVRAASLPGTSSAAASSLGIEQALGVSAVSSEDEPFSRSLSPPASSGTGNGSNGNGNNSGGNAASRTTRSAQGSKQSSNSPPATTSPPSRSTPEKSLSNVAADSLIVPPTKHGPSPKPTQARRSTTVDYMEPRLLHEDFSPPALSTYEDPIYELVQDMREQRMSLCQSLRQYVFVHAAVIEGALILVDEEKERAKMLMAERSSRSGSGSGSGSRGGSGTGSGSGSGSQSPKGDDTDMVIEEPQTPVYIMPSSGNMMSSPATGKRGASPTELLKEDKKGEVALVKRPSLKRKATSDDGAAASTTIRRQPSQKK